MLDLSFGRPGLIRCPYPGLRPYPLKERQWESNPHFRDMPGEFPILHRRSRIAYGIYIRTAIHHYESPYDPSTGGNEFPPPPARSLLQPYIRYCLVFDQCPSLRRIAFHSISFH